MISFFSNRKKQFTKAEALAKELEAVVKMSEETLYTLSFKKNKDVKFDDIVNVLTIGLEVEIAAGVFVTLIEVSKDTFLIYCRMLKGAILLMHFHSDYDEIFDVLTGVLHDLEGRSIYRAGESVTFEAGKHHTPFAEIETTIHIAGKRIK